MHNPFYCRSIFRLSALILLLTTATLRAAGIEYPAAGNLRLDEGTLELWITPMVDDLYPDTGGKYQNHFVLFSLSVPEHFTCGAAWISRNSAQHGVNVSLSMPGRERALLPLFAISKAGWKKGDKHHVAFTWNGKRMRLFLDGKQAAEREQAERWEGPLVGRNLIIGNPGRDSRIILHAVRISSAARDEAMLADAQPVSDIFTLLLDAFTKPDDIDSLGNTKPQQISSFNPQQTGQLKGKYQFVQEPAAGLALYAPGNK